MGANRQPSHYDIFIPAHGISFDVDAFDELMREHGVTLQHYKALPCPLGVFDRDDNRSHVDHDNCSNGFLYEYGGEVTAFFSGNSNSPALEVFGIADGSTVQVTLPRFYDNDGEQISVQHYDRFFLKDVEVFSTNGEQVEYHQSGVDRLRYPIQKVESIVDARGRRYQQDRDFQVIQGNICWQGDNRPGFDPQQGRGVVYSVRYRYRPFYYVRSLIHEVRVSRDIDYETGNIKLQRMPYALVLQREYVYENERRSTKGVSDSRDMQAPRSGGFGPR